MKNTAKPAKDNAKSTMASRPQFEQGKGEPNKSSREANVTKTGAPGSLKY